MAGKYLFVIALPRSGSTLLAYVLDSHSEIHFEHEDDARPHTWRKDRAIHNLLWKITNGFEAYLDSFLASTNKTNLVTSRYYRKQQVHSIVDALGNKAKFIILTRKHMWRAFYTGTGQGRVVPLRWIWQFSVCRDFVKRNSLEHIEVSYKDITSRPEQAFANICVFIGVKHEPGMLDYQSFEHPHLTKRGNVKTRQLGRIIDKSEDERLSIAMLYQSMIARFYGLMSRIFQAIE